MQGRLNKLQKET